jgi:hypothetical protein
VLKGRYAPNKQILARKLCIAYRTLVTDYWKRPGRPENHSEGSSKYEVEAYRNWIRDFKSAHNFGSQQADEGAKDLYPFNERERALIEKNQISAKREKFKLEVEMAEYVPRVVANRVIDTGNRIVRTEMEKAFANELPPRLEGLKAAEIRRVLLTRLRQLTDHLPGHIQKVYGTNGNGS